MGNLYVRNAVFVLIRASIFGVVSTGELYILVSRHLIRAKNSWAVVFNHFHFLIACSAWTVMWRCLFTAEMLYLLLETCGSEGFSQLKIGLLFFSICCWLVSLMEHLFTARAYARAILGVVILFVRLSHAWIVTNLNGALQIFWYHTKGQSLCYSDTKSGWWATPPVFLKSAFKVTHPLRKTPTSTDFRS